MLRNLETLCFTNLAETARQPLEVKDQKKCVHAIRSQLPKIMKPEFDRRNYFSQGDGILEMFDLTQPLPPTIVKVFSTPRPALPPTDWGATTPHPPPPRAHPPPPRARERRTGFKVSWAEDSEDNERLNGMGVPSHPDSQVLTSHQRNIPNCREGGDPPPPPTEPPPPLPPRGSAEPEGEWGRLRCRPPLPSYLSYNGRGTHHYPYYDHWIEFRLELRAFLDRELTGWPPHEVEDESKKVLRCCMRGEAAVKVAAIPIDKVSFDTLLSMYGVLFDDQPRKGSLGMKDLKQHLHQGLSEFGARVMSRAMGAYPTMDGVKYSREKKQKILINAYREGLLDPRVQEILKKEKVKTFWMAQKRAQEETNKLAMLEVPPEDKPPDARRSPPPDRRREECNRRECRDCPTKDWTDLDHKREVRHPRDGHLEPPQEEEEESEDDSSDSTETGVDERGREAPERGTPEVTVDILHELEVKLAVVKQLPHQGVGGESEILSSEGLSSWELAQNQALARRAHDLHQAVVGMQSSKQKPCQTALQGLLQSVLDLQTLQSIRSEETVDPTPPLVWDKQGKFLQPAASALPRATAT